MTSWFDESRAVYQELDELSRQLREVSQAKERHDPVAAMERARLMLEISTKIRAASARLRVIAEDWRQETSWRSQEQVAAPSSRMERRVSGGRIVS